MRRALITAVVFVLSGCATGAQDRAPPRPAKVNPASLAATPATWDGREVEIVGFLVWEFERLGLYQSYGAYCRDAEKSAIAVDWNNWPGVTKADNRRQVMVRGTFRNQYGTSQPGGQIISSNGAPGPGPLEPGSVVRWLSAPAKPCPRALP